MTVAAHRTIPILAQPNVATVAKGTSRLDDFLRQLNKLDNV
jgi:hypothetical protein